MPTFYEFFAGGGLARIGLGPEWRCLFANDISPMKAEAYLQNFGALNKEFLHCDINDLRADQLPGTPDLVWGSFPCQDLSLAGSGRGLGGARSGLVWKLLEIVESLAQEDRGPKALVLENVTGLLSSRGGEDFYDILRALKNLGYVFGMLMMDAVYFVPQSRPRIFLVAVDSNQIRPGQAPMSRVKGQGLTWTSSRLDSLWRSSPRDLLDHWVWWNVPMPSMRRTSLLNLLDSAANVWDLPAYTDRLIGMMSPLHRKKVDRAAALGVKTVGALYRRTRVVDGVRLQRVEVRFDGISGCLRTPSGGSSRQRLLFVENGDIRTRLLSGREAARLMGIPEDYELPLSYNKAYQLAGDGVAVPVVAWLNKNLLLPMIATGVDSATESEDCLLYA